jgi:ribosomal protein S18 acetylase RimI-like enzyme
MSPAGFTIRIATEADVPAIVRLLADDFLGATRESVSDPIGQQYTSAFAEVAASNATDIVVLEVDGEVAGTMQIFILPGLASQGSRRLEIESVRVASNLRSQGYGEKLIDWAVQYARDHGCNQVQLTSHKERVRAHEFYRRLGFRNSHEGFKLNLE